jgi:uncharacterized membrane protein
MNRSTASRIAIVAAGSTAILLAVRHKGARRRSMNRTAKTMRVSSVITVGRSKDQLYRKWRDPQFMSEVFGDIFQISDEGDERIGVRARLADRREVSWMSRLVEQQDGSSLLWRTDPGAVVPHEIFVQFRDARPAEWGTEVTVGVSPLSKDSFMRAIFHITESVDKAVLTRVLRRFKALIETGEMPTLFHNPAGRHRAIAAA